MLASDLWDFLVVFNRSINIFNSEKLFIGWLKEIFVYLIIGVDPGLNVGYAALDLNGKLVGAGVVKQKNADKVVGIIAALGIPLLAACDVAKSPHFVKTVARRFAVKVHCPAKNMTQEEKQIIARSAMDPHIRDAYAAAIKAYRRYSNRFGRIDKLYPEKSEEYKRLVIEGKPVGKVAKER
jgi:predicted RNase H-like nuclease (RuvC/YqgF family)